MSDVKKEYEEMFGSNIWREKIGDADFESYIKDQIKSKLMRVKAMNVKAKERGVVLGREEKDSVGFYAYARWLSLRLGHKMRWMTMSLPPPANP